MSAGCEEARAIFTALSPLTPLCEALAAAELTDSGPLLAPLLHSVCLLWAHTPPYRKGLRVVTFFRELANLFIEMVGSSFFILFFKNLATFFADMVCSSYLSSSRNWQTYS